MEGIRGFQPGDTGYSDKFRGQGLGTRMIQEFKQDRPRLWLSGYAHSPEAAKFWRKVDL